MKLNVVLHPILFAIFPVIFLFSNNISQVHYYDLILPLFITSSISFGIIIISRIILKNTIKTGFIVSTGFILFFSFGYIHNLLDGIYFAGIDLGQFRIILPVLLITFIIITFFFVVTKKKLDNANTIVNVIAITLVIISMGNIAIFIFESEFLELEYLNEEISLMSTETTPNVYYILLDGYPRADNLKKYYNFDNSNFINFLKENEFYVAEKSTTNYPRTYLAISSALNMQYVNHIAEKLGEDSKDVHEIKRMISNNQVMEKFKNLEYTIVNFDSVMSSENNIDIVDYQLCRKNIYIENEFFMMLIGSSVLKFIYQDLLDVGRDQMLCVLDTLPKLHHEIPEPFFVYAHLLLPHPPYIFGADGEENRPESLELGDQNSWKDKEGFINFLKFGNKKIQAIIESILLEENSSPIIIIQGDHGTEQTYNVGEDELTEIRIQERMPILNAYYFPNDSNSLYETITPVNTFRVIFNEYFNGTYDLLEDRNYWSDDFKPNKFLDITNKITEDQK